jgi:hypothetical protein
MFNRLQRADGFLAPRAWPPEVPEAEAPAPSHSAEGTRFRLGIICACPALDIPQTAAQPGAGRHDWHGSVIRQQAPLYVRPGYKDLIGAFIARVAKQVPVLSAIRYGGQIPMYEQPILPKPDAWDDPTRGAP